MGSCSSNAAAVNDDGDAAKAPIELRRQPSRDATVEVARTDGGDAAKAPIELRRQPSQELARALQFVQLDAVYRLLKPVQGGGPPPVRLLDSEWILARADQLAAARDDGERQALAMLCRQDLEQQHPEAFLSLNQVKQLVVCDARHGYKFGTGAVAIGAVSHAWLRPDHPDPHGAQLLKLAAALRAAQAGELPRQQRGWDSKQPWRHGYQRLPARVGLFFDWASLYQARKAADGTVLADRSPEQRAAFDTALGSMQIWYVHQKLFSVLLTSLPDDVRDLPAGAPHPRPYWERGWPVVEHAWTMVAKPNNLSCWPMIYDVGAGAAGVAERRPPLHPRRLRQLLEEKAFTSPKADRPLVARLYEETVAAMMGEAHKLSFGECGFADTHVVTFAEVLPLCTACTTLNLARNDMGDAGATSVAEAIAAGALPHLGVLALDHNARIGDAGLEALMEAAMGGRMCALRKLFLGDCHAIGEAGCRALTRALEAGVLPKLTEVMMARTYAATGLRDGREPIVCRYWAEGACAKGAACRFVHGPLPPSSAAWVALEAACAARGIDITGRDPPRPAVAADPSAEAHADKAEPSAPFGAAATFGAEKEEAAPPAAPDASVPRALSSGASKSKRPHPNKRRRQQQMGSLAAGTASIGEVVPQVRYTSRHT